MSSSNPNDGDDQKLRPLLATDKPHECHPKAPNLAPAPLEPKTGAAGAPGRVDQKLKFVPTSLDPQDPNAGDRK